MSYTVHGSNNDHLAWSGASITFGLALTAFVVVGPLVVHLVSHAPEFTESSCPTGQETVYVRISPGSFLRVVEDNTDLNAILSQARVTSYYVEETGGYPTIIEINRTGRYVRVQLTEKNYL